METCNKCSGTGMVDWGMVPSIGGIGGYIMETRPCKACNGSGVHVDCQICLDTGEIALEQLPDGRWNLSGPYGPCNCAAGQRVAAGELVTVAGVVRAPGFTERTFTAALKRARGRGYMNIRPYRDGSLRIDAGRSGEVYRVTRSSCSCQAGRSHGYCLHRAAAIACADLYAIDLCRSEVLGFDAQGRPVTAADRVAQLGEAA